MFQFTVDAVSVFKPVLLQLRFVAACSLLVLCGWSLASFAIDAVARGKKMHQIPCTKCRFFTGDYRLKCTVNPNIANSEQAIDCSDFRSKHLYE